MIADEIMLENAIAAHAKERDDAKRKFLGDLIIYLRDKMLRVETGLNND